LPSSGPDRALTSEPSRPQATPSSERRRTPRTKPVGLTYVKLEPDNGGRLLDVCESGIGFQVVAPVEESGRIQLWFVLDAASHIEVSGELAWIDDSRRSGGLKFTRPSKQARQQLRDWLSSQQPEATATDEQLASPPSVQSQDLAHSAATTQSEPPPHYLSHESEFERHLHTLPHTDPAPLESLLNTILSSLQTVLPENLFSRPVLADDDAQAASPTAKIEASSLVETMAQEHATAMPAIALSAPAPTPIAAPLHASASSSAATPAASAPAAVRAPAAPRSPALRRAPVTQTSEAIARAVAFNSGSTLRTEKTSDLKYAQFRMAVDRVSGMLSTLRHAISADDSDWPLTAIPEFTPSVAAQPVEAPAVPPMAAAVVAPIGASAVAQNPTPVATPITEPLAKRLAKRAGKRVAPPVVTPVSTPVATPIAAPVVALAATQVATSALTPITKPVPAPIVAQAIASVAPPAVTPAATPIVVQIATPVPAPDVAPTLPPVAASVAATTAAPIAAPTIEPAVVVPAPQSRKFAEAKTEPAVEPEAQIEADARPWSAGAPWRAAEPRVATPSWYTTLPSRLKQFYAATLRGIASRISRAEISCAKACIKAGNITRAAAAAISAKTASIFRAAKAGIAPVISRASATAVAAGTKAIRSAQSASAEALAKTGPALRRAGASGAAAIARASQATTAAASATAAKSASAATQLREAKVLDASREKLATASTGIKNVSSKVLRTIIPGEPTRAEIGTMVAITVLLVASLAAYNYRDKFEAFANSFSSGPSAELNSPAPETTPASKKSSGHGAKVRRAATTAQAGAGESDQQAMPTPSTREMATALAYLSNNRGQRDATTAAQWLWAATRKGDTGANIVLADLYIRGDGVPQNCAQGRVLLLAASKKGNNQATQNLQQLDATACGNATQ
jgi:trimeric autotransporter adhesin